MTYTIVRPGGLTDEPGGQMALHLDQGDRAGERVSRADVVEVCLQALEQPATRNVTFELFEAEGPPPTDWAELFATLELEE